jgi:hypothetical protein
MAFPGSGKNAIIIIEDSMSDVALRMEEAHFTYGEYKEWELAEGERYELINGVAYAMPAPTMYHQAILMALAAKFYIFLKVNPVRFIKFSQNFPGFWGNFEVCTNPPAWARMICKRTQEI